MGRLHFPAIQSLVLGTNVTDPAQTGMASGDDSDRSLHQLDGIKRHCMMELIKIRRKYEAGNAVTFNDNDSLKFS